MAIKYFLTYGGLPIGTEIEEGGLIKGLMSYDNLFTDNPKWETPAGSLGTFKEYDTPEIPPLSVTSPGSYSIVRLSLVRDDHTRNFAGLPWGLELNPETGQISGTIVDLLDPLAQYWTDEEIPVWITPSQRLGKPGENETVSYTIQAEGAEDKSISHYFVCKGALPWGLELEASTGIIQGTTFAGVYEDDPDETDIEDFPPPIWITPRGSLGNRNEKSQVDIQFLADADGTRGIARFLIQRGALPWGLELTPTGRLHGTIGLVWDPLEPQYLIPGPPVFSGPINLIWKVGTPVELPINVTPLEDRTISTVYATNYSVFPWGVEYNPVTRIISGTPQANLASPQYSITFRAIDNAGAFSYQTYNIQVMP